MDERFVIVEALERELASEEARSEPRRMKHLLHEDFGEFGKSGRIYDKPMILAEVPTWEYFDTVLSDFTYFGLSENVVMLKYKSDVGGIQAHRTSIWVKENSRWQMLHHQGTICG